MFENKLFSFSDLSVEKKIWLINSGVFDKASSRRRINLQIPVSDYCTLGEKQFGPLEVENKLRSK